jgi:hypothetical protein
MIAQAFFKVMASQVRPGLTQPTRRQGTSTVRLIVQASTSKFHQGPRLRPHTEAGCMAAISPCDPELKESAWQNGASMYVAGHPPCGPAPFRWTVFRLRSLHSSSSSPSILPEAGSDAAGARSSSFFIGWEKSTAYKARGAAIVGVPPIPAPSRNALRGVLSGSHRAASAVRATRS